MGRQARLRDIRRSLRRSQKLTGMTAEMADNVYRRAKGRESPAPGPWPMTQVVDRSTGKPFLGPVSRRERWRRQAEVM